MSSYFVFFFYFFSDIQALLNFRLFITIFCEQFDIALIVTIKINVEHAHWIII